MHGTGEFHFASGAVYRGGFNENVYHGYGTYTSPSGASYKVETPLTCNLKVRLTGQGTMGIWQDAWRWKLHRRRWSTVGRAIL